MRHFTLTLGGFSGDEIDMERGDVGGTTKRGEHASGGAAARGLCVGEGLREQRVCSGVVTDSQSLVCNGWPFTVR